MSAKQLTDRRASVDQQIAYYALQASLARQGIARRSEAFYLRQIEYFRMEAR